MYSVRAAEPEVQEMIVPCGNVGLWDPGWLLGSRFPGSVGWFRVVYLLLSEEDSHAFFQLSRSERARFHARSGHESL